MITRIKNLFRGDSLSGRARMGSVLTAVDFAGSNALRLASNLILTRLLFPEAFGLMALVQVVTGAVLMFSDFGIRASLVRHERGDDQDFIDTAWTLKVIRGAILWAIVAAISPVMADFYDEPMLAQLLPVAGASALIGGFTPTSITTANRHLILGRVTALSIGNQIVNIILTVALAWWLQSVWALVFGILGGALFRNISIRLFMPGPRNRFRLERAAMKDLINFGKFVLIATIAAFLVNNADRAILGKFIAVDLLGIYVLATTLALMPLKMMQAFTWKIIFPMYSQKPPQDSVGNRRKIRQARFAITGFGMLGCALLVLFGDQVVRLLYPSTYHAAGVMAILVAVGSLPGLILTTYAPFLLSANRAGQHAFLDSIHAVLKVTFLYFAMVEYGIPGAALAPVLSTLLYYPLLVILIRPYKAWDPLYDAVFFAATIGLVALGWWLNADAIAAFAASASAGIPD